MQGWCLPAFIFGSASLASRYVGILKPVSLAESPIQIKYAFSSQEDLGCVSVCSLCIVLWVVACKELFQNFSPVELRPVLLNTRVSQSRSVPSVGCMLLWL